MVTRFGGRVLIANGKIPYVIKKIFTGEEIGTMFLPQTEELSDKKRWIGYATNIIGQIVVNDGAKKALLAQKSLLPIGVIIAILGLIALIISLIANRIVDREYLSDTAITLMLVISIIIETFGAFIIISES